MTASLHARLPEVDLLVHGINLSFHLEPGCVAVAALLAIAYKNGL
jgi:hypothetical protein